MKRFLLPISVAALLASACTYYWKVGPDSPGEGGAADAGAEGGSPDADPQGDAGGPNCDGLEFEIGIARSKLLACATVCSEHVVNQCGCVVPVVDANSEPAKQLVDLSAQFRKASCPTTNCPSPCERVLNVCFKGADGGGGVCI
jgi:hypothetical protein